MSRAPFKGSFKGGRDIGGWGPNMPFFFIGFESVSWSVGDKAGREHLRNERGEEFGFDVVGPQ